MRDKRHHQPIVRPFRFPAALQGAVVHRVAVRLAGGIYFFRKKLTRARGIRGVQPLDGIGRSHCGEIPVAIVANHECLVVYEQFTEQGNYKRQCQHDERPVATLDRLKALELPSCQGIEFPSHRG